MKTALLLGSFCGGLYPTVKSSLMRFDPTINSPSPNSQNIP
jgi:hypothetical protein|nr:hypothetical protein [Serratia fonticola]